MRRLLSIAVALVAVGVLGTAGPAAAESAQSFLLDTAKLSDRTLTYTATVLDGAGDVETATTNTSTFNKRGDLVATASETVNGEWVVSDSSSESLVYDSAGRVLKSTLIQDGDGAGPSDPQTVKRVLTYDSKGILASVTTTIDFTSDGVIDTSTVDTIDNSNRLVTTITLEVRAGDGTLVNVTTNSTTFDRKGSVVESRNTSDTLSTQGLEFESVDVFTYDSARRLLTRVGTATFSGSISTTTLQNTYDNRGNRIAATLIQVGDATTERIEDTAEFDSKGREIIRRRATSVDDKLTAVVTVETSYDSKGRVVGEVTSSDDLANGPGIDQIKTIAVTYDSKGRVVGDVTGTDDLANGPGIDQTDTTAYTYDSKGRLVSYTFTGMVAGNTTFSISGTVTYDGTTTTETQHIDQDGDGVVDRTVILTSPSS